MNPLANSTRRDGASLGAPKRSGGERSEPERSEGAPGSASLPGLRHEPSAPDPEVPEKAQRRYHTAEYKLRLLEETDVCRPGEIGAILRREGLYSSHLRTWRRQRAEGTLHGLTPKKRGRKQKTAAERRNEELEKENQKLRRRLEEAQIIIEFQKKVADLLGIPLQKPENEAK